MQDPTKKITPTKTTVRGDEDGNNDDVKNPENKRNGDNSHRSKKMPKVRRDDRFKLPVDILTLDNDICPDLSPDNVQGYEIRFHIFVVPFKPICGKPVPPEDTNAEPIEGDNDSDFNVSGDTDTSDDTNTNTNN